jgi:uncharacterized membrane protein
MLILIGLASICFGGLLVLRLWDHFNLDLLVVVSVMSGVLLVLCLISWPIAYFDGRSEIRKYHALKSSIMKARENNDVERTAIYLKVMEYNEGLATTKYWNNTIFDIWTPDELANLPFIE